MTNTDAHDLDRLEKLAEAATPGEWRYEPDDEGSSMGWIMHGNPGKPLFTVCGDGAQQAVNAEYTAVMHPATALALIARVRELEGKEEDLIQRCVYAAIESLGRDPHHTPNNRGITIFESVLKEVKEALPDTHARDTTPIVSHETGNVSDDLCERLDTVARGAEGHNPKRRLCAEAAQRIREQEAEIGRLRSGEPSSLLREEYERNQRLVKRLHRAEATAPAPQAAPHPDDQAVDRFASAMKAKLKWEREERGRGGWDNPDQCSIEYLADLLHEHMAKGNRDNFVDLANFCMMLHLRGADPSVLRDAPQPVPHCSTCNDTGSVEAIVESAEGPVPCPYIGAPCPDCDEGQRFADAAPSPAPQAAPDDEVRWLLEICTRAGKGTLAGVDARAVKRIVERLAAELTEAEEGKKVWAREAENLRKVIGGEWPHAKYWQASCERAEASVQRLKAALERLLRTNLVSNRPTEGGETESAVIDAYAALRGAALEGKE